MARQSTSEKNTGRKEPSAAQDYVLEADLDILRNLSFTPVPDLLQPLLMLLSNTPAGFSSGSLRDFMEKVMRAAGDIAGKTLSFKSDASLPRFDTNSLQQEGAGGDLRCAEGFSREGVRIGKHQCERPFFYMSASGSLLCNFDIVCEHHLPGRVIECRICNTEAEPFVFGKKSAGDRRVFHAGMNCLFMGELNGQQSSGLSVTQRMLRDCWFIASKLVRAGAVMPKLMIDGDNNMQCIWIPAVISREVRSITEQAGLVLQSREHLLLHRIDRSRRLDPLYLGSQVLSVFITGYIRDAYKKCAEKVSTRNFRDDVLTLFHESHLSVDADLDKRSMRQRLESWLAPLSFGTQSLIPVLRFYDLAESEFALSEKARLFKGCAVAAKDQELGRAVSHEGFSMSPGVGIEIGFTGFDDELMQRLRRLDIVDDASMVPLHEILSRDLLQGVRYECMRTVSRLSEVADFIKEPVMNSRSVSLVSLDALFGTLEKATGALSMLGVRVVLPKSLRRIMRPHAAVRMDLSDGEGSASDPAMAGTLLKLNSMLRFSWELALDDKHISRHEFDELLKLSGKVVRFNKGFVYADPTELGRISERMHKQDVGMAASANQMQLLNAVLSKDFEGNRVLLSERLADRLKDLITEKEEDLPSRLNASLRPYQKRGYDWLMHNIKIGIGSILADDMGLGKTLQVISALLKLKQDGRITVDAPALVIVPTSLIENWKHELARFAPEILFDEFYGNVSFKDLRGDVIITTYGTVKNRLAQLKSVRFPLLVIDEAQAIKNRRTGVNRAVMALKADHCIALSGTPVENHLSEYYAILDFTNRGMFGTIENFSRRFAVPIERDRNARAVEVFKELTSPFIMRRVKSDKNVINDLPEKIISNVYCRLTETQAALYQSVVDSAMRTLSEQNGRAVQVLNLMTDLRQICNSPAQYDKSDSLARARDSGKVERLLELVDTIMESGGKVLIFTQFTTMGKCLQEIFKEEFDIRPDFLHGALSSSERKKIVDRFQSTSSAENPVLLLSLRSAGTGLNLTAANYVIHYDLWWNPAVENQATDRAYRIGQSKNVQVYRLICAHTFEERINELIESKRDLAELTVTAGENFLVSLSDRQLKELLSLSRDEREDA